MKTLLSVFVCLFLLSCSEENKIAVKATFENYQTAILNDNGQAAFKNIDKKTREYYSWASKSAKELDEKAIKALGFMDKMMILLIRQRVSRSDVLKMDGKALFIYAVENGWVGKNGVSQLSIGDISVNNNFATGVVLNNNQKSPLKFHFYKEDQLWKIDLTEISKWGEAMFVSQQKKSGKTMDEYILLLVQIVSKKPVDLSTIYKPLI